ncbi:hypothetical protein OG196_11400 [Kitasatospora purpeofusca]|uniref:hypothetical protein n=1 Tax=Kitasatospora purpeofusca TaxID=67352 RepID=UPI002E110675|nr:hypothetical protein OG196_11400 [Kitasatospora purpeofusca]
MASRYGPLRYGADGARLGRGEARDGEPVFDREGLRREGGGEEIRWGAIERIDVEVRDIGLKSWAQNALMFLLTVGSVTQRAPGTEDSYLWVKPVDGPPVRWGFEVPPRSEARWSPGPCAGSCAASTGPDGGPTSGRRSWPAVWRRCGGSRSSRRGRGTVRSTGSSMCCRVPIECGTGHDGTDVTQRH